MNNKLVQNPSDIAEIFNKFFCEIGSNLSNKLPQPQLNSFKKYMGESATQSMFLHETNPTEVERIINNFENKNSTGHDEISTKFIKISSSYFSKFISEIINQAIKIGQYPNQLKIAKVIPYTKRVIPLTRITTDQLAS